jgi:hypothetical protein
MSAKCLDQSEGEEVGGKEGIEANEVVRWRRQWGCWKRVIW